MPATQPDRASTMLQKRHAEALRLDDAHLYKQVEGVPIMTAHEPISKRVRDPSAVTKANPSGLVEKMLECDEDDLRTAAENSNKMVAMGRPPVLQIGHTPLEDGPEDSFPKPVGLVANFRVDKLDGKPALFADIYYRAGHGEEASTYPNISVERTNWQDPASHAISAVALLRRRPELDLPRVPAMAAYTRGPARTSLVCYGRAMPVPASSPAPAVVTAAKDRQERIDLMGRFGVDHKQALAIQEGRAPRPGAKPAPPLAPAPLLRGELLKFAEKHPGLPMGELLEKLHRDTTFRVCYAMDQIRDYEASTPRPVSPPGKPRISLADYATKIGCFDPGEVTRRYTQAVKRGEI
jgi:hypothetical protein